MSEQARKSRYAEKVARRNQMYGPGCCGHDISSASIEAAKAEARARRHYMWTPGSEAPRPYYTSEQIRRSPAWLTRTT